MPQGSLHLRCEVTPAEMAERNLAAVLRDLHAAVQGLQLEAGASRRRIEQLEQLGAERAAALRLVERVLATPTIHTLTIPHALLERVAKLEEHETYRGNLDDVRGDTLDSHKEALASLETETAADRMYTHQLAGRLDRLEARVERLEALDSDRLEALERISKLEAFAAPHVHHFGNVNDSHACVCGALPPSTPEE
jgi:hypothetical protein